MENARISPNFRDEDSLPIKTKQSSLWVVQRVVTSKSYANLLKLRYKYSPNDTTIRESHSTHTCGYLSPKATREAVQDNRTTPGDLSYHNMDKIFVFMTCSLFITHFALFPFPKLFFFYRQTGSRCPVVLFHSCPNTDFGVGLLNIISHPLP